MNGTGTRIYVAVVLLTGLAAGGCGDPDPVLSYCNRYSYCFEGYDRGGCIEERESLEEQARGMGEACHTAFLYYHECVGELSCADLDEYLADNVHCGTAYNAWQNRCLSN